MQNTLFFIYLQQSISSELSWQSLCPSHLNFVWIPRPFLHLKYPTKYKIHLSLCFILLNQIHLISISTINSSNSVKNSPNTSPQTISNNYKVCYCALCFRSLSTDIRGGVIIVIYRITGNFCCNLISAVFCSQLRTAEIKIAEYYGK